MSSTHVNQTLKKIYCIHAGGCKWKGKVVTCLLLSEEMYLFLRCKKRWDIYTERETKKDRKRRQKTEEENTLFSVEKLRDFYEGKFMNFAVSGNLYFN